MKTSSNVQPINLGEATLPPDPNDYAAYVQM